MNRPSAPPSPGPDDRRFAITAAKVIVVEIAVLAALWALQVRFTP